MKLPDKLLIFSILILIFTFYGSNVAGEKNNYLDAEDHLRAESRIVGSSAVCLNGAFIFVDYSTEAEPGDNIYWSMRDAAGFEISNQRGPVVSIPYTSEGTFTLSLRISRGGNPDFHNETIEVVVQRGPTFILQPDVVLCGSEEVALTALDPNDPNLDIFTIEWTDTDGNPIGTGNTIVTSTPGRYIVNVASVACLVTGSTFVGPSLEVELSQSTTNACLGSTVTFTPDVPVNGLWSYQKSDQATRTDLGNFFQLSLDTDELDGVGDYTIFFNVEDEDRPGCSVEKQRNLIVRDNASFEIFDIINSESCDNPTGGFTLIPNTGMQSIEVTGPMDTLFINVWPGTVLDLTDLEPGIYTIEAESYECYVTSTVTIGNLNPDAGIPFTVASSDETCSGTGINPGTITITVEDISPELEYRIINAEGDVTQGTFGNQLSVTEDVLAGVYSIEVIDADNCSSVSADIHTVSGSDQVSFSVPLSIIACEFYVLRPQSNQTLRYEVTDTNGQQISSEDDGSFIISNSGTYEILGISDNPDSPLCPNLKTFEIEINDQIVFDYSQRQIDCLGNQIFTAELLGMDPSTVFIRWLASDNITILGRDLNFFPPSVGTFYLDVQPRASSQCPAAPIPFEVTAVQREVEVEIEGTPFCGQDPFTSLTVVTDFDIIEFIEWYYIDEEGNYIHLENYQNMETIDVTDEGTYVVVVRNDIYCEMGRTTYEVERILEITLTMSAKQNICIEEQRFNTLNPGDFVSYNWLKDGEVLSTDSIFTPREPGNYELEVVDPNGCPVNTQFEVEDICAQLISMPSAMVPGDLARDFRVYANPAISEIEVFVFNKLGELIFHCQSENNIDTDAICIWDGYVNGTKLMVGTYPVTVKYTVPSLNLSDHVNSFIVVPK